MSIHVLLTIVQLLILQIVYLDGSDGSQKDDVTDKFFFTVIIFYIFRLIPKNQ